MASRIIFLILFFIVLLCGPWVVYAGDDGSNYEYSVMGIANYTNLNDLNNDDATTFRTRMNNRNWNKYMEGYNTQVGENSFGYAAPSDFMFFTGHGDWDGDDSTKYAGSCLTNYEGDNWPFPPSIVLYNDVDNKWNNDIEWAIFAACHTLRDARWKYPLNDNPKAHAIYGYRDVSSELNDQDIINDFFDYLRNWTLYDSWRWANQDNSELNWAIIGHLNNKGDYLHGVKSGATSDCSDTTDLYRWYNDDGLTSRKLTTDISYKPKKEKKGFFARIYNKIANLPIFKSILVDTSYADSGFVRDGFDVKTEIPTTSIEMPTLEVISESISENNILNWFKDVQFNEEIDGIKRYKNDNEIVEMHPSGAIKYLRQGNGETFRLNKEEVIKIANQFIDNHGGFPKDAELFDVGTTVQENLDSEKKEILSYTVKYYHKWKGVPVSFNGDNITVEVSKDGVSYYSRLWRTISREKENPNRILPALQALDNSWKTIKNNIKNAGDSISVENIDLVYYSDKYDRPQSSMEPAWRLKISNDYFYINAVTGKLIEN